jgi:hypothetical protein
LLPLCFALLSLPACELVASFDQSKLDQNRTLVPTPIPTLDGAVAVVPDASLRFDGALVRVDTGVPAPADAAADAASDASLNDASDGQLPDAALVDAGDAGDAGAGDAGDAGAGDAGDAGNVDAGPLDGGPQDASLAPDLFADV